MTETPATPRRKLHRTAQIKPATRNAVLDFLAQTADGLIAAHRERELIDACCDHWQQGAAAWQREATLPLWQRLRRWVRS